MTRPESSPAYLEHCVSTFLDALREVDAMAHAGNVDPLRSARGLLAGPDTLH